MSEGGSSGQQVSVLVVCTANICRSPFTEEMIRRSAPSWGGGGLDVTVTSAGVFAAGHRGICPELWEISSVELPLSHEPCQAEPAAILAADLVIALAQGHRAELAKLAPKARARTFTLTEAATLAAAITQPQGALDAALGRVEFADEFDPLSRVEQLPASQRERFGWLVCEMNAWRGSVRVENESIDDPHESEIDIHETVAASIEQASSEFASAVRSVLQA